MIDDSTSISWESVYKTSRSWVDVLIVYVLLFGVVSGLMRFCDGSDKGTASMHQILCKSRKREEKTLAMIRQVFG
jgi:hypothetical protein